MKDSLYEKFLNSYKIDNIEFLTKFNEMEKICYKKLLNINRSPILGIFKDFCTEFNVEPIIFMGFLYGLNDNLKTPNNLENITEDTIITLDYDEKLLYKNMLSINYDMSVWNGHEIHDNQPNPDLTPQQIAAANAQAQEWLNKPKCPTCGSTNVEKISFGKKAVGGALFGLLSSDVRKSMHCKNCGYKW